MLSFTSRAGFPPAALALIALAATTVLAACADEPTSTSRIAAQAPNANTLADPFTVVNLNDHGIGSLRWVLSYADSGQTIRFDPTLAGKTIVLDSVIKMYLKNVTIEGPRDRGITISGGGKTRVFETWGAGPYVIRNLAVTGGAAGPAILGSNKVVLENSTMYGNALTVKGSAIDVQTLTLINSTVSGNGADSTAGFAVAASQKVELINSTVAYNAGGGVGTTPSIVLRNSILSNNGWRNCSTPLVVTLEGTNVSDDDSCAGPTEIVIADPKLATLGDNGGPTTTHAIGAGSPAVNVGTSCTVAADQRYVPRDTPCDLGAYEFTDPTSVTVTIDASVPVSQSNGWAVVSGMVQCSRAETFSITVQLVQQQRTGKTTTPVDAANIVPVQCSTTARPWTASMVLTNGSFQIGSATASAQTVSGQPWVTPASVTGAVKLYWARR